MVNIVNFFDWSPPPMGGGYKFPTGLSNVTYLTAPNSTVNQRRYRDFPNRSDYLYTTSLEVFPSRVRLRAKKMYKSGNYGEDFKSSTQNKTPRKSIREFSEKSRDNLRQIAYDLSVIYVPDIMITLTYPAEWKSVCTPKLICECGANQGSSDVCHCICEQPQPSGKIVKNHYAAFRKRLVRKFRKLGFQTACLWFLEFQKRDAPHLHLILWDKRMREKIEQYGMDNFREWVAHSWAEIVNHPDQEEYEKHVRAGTSVSWMEKLHFGYASKYAAKMEQKEVPSYFQNVGRFWGLFGCSRPKPTEYIDWLSTEELLAVKERLVQNLQDVAPKFVNRIITFVNTTMEYSEKFSFQFFGYMSGTPNLRCPDFSLIPAS